MKQGIGHIKRTYQCAAQHMKEHQAEEEKNHILKRRSNIHVFAIRINIARPICAAMFGRQHSTGVRLFTGLIVAATGVVIAKYVGHSQNEIVAHIGDGIGYGLHGLGLTPFIETLVAKFE